VLINFTEARDVLESLSKRDSVAIVIASSKTVSILVDGVVKALSKSRNALESLSKHESVASIIASPETVQKLIHGLDMGDENTKVVILDVLRSLSKHEPVANSIVLLGTVKELFRDVAKGSRSAGVILQTLFKHESLAQLIAAPEYTETLVDSVTTDYRFYEGYETTRDILKILSSYESVAKVLASEKTESSGYQ
jgi:flagellin-specific chaperone FliS